MKKSNPTIILALFVIAGLLIVGCSQDKQFNSDLGFRTIVLQVNTAAIDSTKKDIEQYCSFPSQPPGVSDSLFTTKVAKGDKILWLGVSSSDPFEDIVAIKKIKHHRLKKILKNTKDQNGMVEGTIDGNSRDGDEEKYTIQFTVTRSGKTKSYKIDPKLQIIR